MKRSSKENFQRLYQMAERQQGFFTAKQAKAAGYDERTHPYHVQAGNWIREWRGIYRLAYYPLAERWDLALWSLWSCNRQGIPEGVYSHDTVLSFYDLSDICPAKLHMTVPKTFRRNSEIPGVLVLYRGELPESDVRRTSGFALTTPLRAVVDLLVEWQIADDILRQALQEGRARGLISYREIEQAHVPAVVRPIFDELVEELL